MRSGSDVIVVIEWVVSSIDQATPVVSNTPVVTDANAWLACIYRTAELGNDQFAREENCSACRGTTRRVSVGGGIQPEPDWRTTTDPLSSRR